MREIPYVSSPEFIMKGTALRSLLVIPLGLALLRASVCSRASLAAPPDLNAIPWLAPSALCVTEDGKTAFVACAVAKLVVAVDTASRKVTAAWPVPEPPTGLIWNKQNGRLYVACAAAASLIVELDPAKDGAEVVRMKAGHTASGPVLSPDGKTLFVCCRFDNTVLGFDLAQHKETLRVAVGASRSMPP